MNTEHSISVLESLITLSGNPDMPLSRAIAALRALAPGAAPMPAPVLRAPITNTVHFDEAVTQSNVMDLLPQAMDAEQADADAVTQAIEQARLAHEAAQTVQAIPQQPAEPAAPKKKRGRPRKNKG